MSCVTNIILLTDSDDVGIQSVQRWLLANDHVPLAEVSDHHSGRKRMECRVWVGGFNYLNLSEFVGVVRSARWESPQSVQLLVRGEDDSTFQEEIGGL